MIDAEPIQIDCVGYSIAADWYSGTIEQVALVLPGYTSTKLSYADLTREIVERTGMSALVLDYGGHGESPFDLSDLTPAQNFLEVITAFDWISENHPELVVSVIGTSYGGFLATQLTKYREFKKLVLRVPALYRPKNFYTKWGNYDHEDGLRYRLEQPDLHNHPLLKRASSFSGETLVITHEFDELCPKNTTDAFIKAFDADKWEAKGFKHGFLHSDATPEKIEEYTTKLIDWLAA